MKKICQVITRISLLLVFIPALSVADVTDHPGYVDLSDISAILGVEPAIQVSLQTPLLNIISRVVEHQDRDAADILARIEWVNVNVFLDGQFDRDSLAGYMAEISDELEANYWERIVRVREEDAYVDVYFQLSEDSSRIYGITVLAAEESEAVLVNIVGDLSVDDINALGGHFDIDELINLDLDGNG